MGNKERYLQIFMDTFSVTEEEARGLEYAAIPAWDSVGHMTLMAELEDAFDIMMDTDDIIEFNSFAKGMEILQNNYEVEF